MIQSEEKSNYWQSIIRDWRASGQPKKEFAKSRGVSADAMSYWVTKFNKAGPSVRKEPSFVPMTISPDCPEDQTITIHLSNGFAVTFSPDTSPAKISALALALSTTYA